MESGHSQIIAVQREESKSGKAENSKNREQRIAELGREGGFKLIGRNCCPLGFVVFCPRSPACQVFVISHLEVWKFGTAELEILRRGYFVSASFL